MKSKASQQNRYLRIITIPIRALSKARDFYVKSLSEYADRMNYGNVMAMPGTSQVSGLPKSFSVSSARSNYDSEDFRELVRETSARTATGVEKVDLDLYIKQQMKMRADGPRAVPPRSSSVAMRRIDEDSPCCYFGEDNYSNSIISANKEIKYPRSKSHAITTRRLSAF